jgi:hypothetical protein
MDLKYCSVSRAELFDLGMDGEYYSVPRRVGVGLSEELDGSFFDGCLILWSRTVLLVFHASLRTAAGDIPIRSVSPRFCPGSAMAPNRRERPLCTELALNEADRAGDTSVERVPLMRPDVSSLSEVAAPELSESSSEAEEERLLEVPAGV